MTEDIKKIKHAFRAIKKIQLVFKMEKIRIRKTYKSMIEKADILKNHSF
jgi:hypothetical protein